MEDKEFKRTLYRILIASLKCRINKTSIKIQVYFYRNNFKSNGLAVINKKLINVFTSSGLIALMT